MFGGAVMLSGVLLVEGSVSPGCGEQVSRLYELGRYVEAARTAEDCWEQTSDPLLLYFAGQARAAVGHRSHAAVLLRRYLEQLAADAPQRSRAENKLAAMMAGLVEVSVEAPVGPLLFQRDGVPDALSVDWPGGTGSVALEPGNWKVWTSAEGPTRARAFVAGRGVRVEISRPEVRPPPRPAPVDVQIRVSPARALRRGGRLELRGADGKTRDIPVRSAATRLGLTPGEWRATLRIPGRETVTRGVQVRGPVELVFQPGLDRASKARLGLGIGLGTASVGLLAWGSAWVGRGRATLGSGPSPADALDSYGLWVDGAAVMSAGMGTLGVAVTDLLGARRLALVLETGIGGGLTLAGATWREVAKGRLTEASAATGGEVDHQVPLLIDRHPRETLASVICGVGAGLFGAGAVSLVTMALVERGARAPRRLEPVAGPLGFGLRGRF